jgi:hypothetical protein
MRVSNDDWSIKITPAFKLVLLIASTWTACTFAAALHLGSQDNLSPEQYHVLSRSSTGWKMGGGLIVGLVGGKIS